MRMCACIHALTILSELVEQMKFSGLRKKTESSPHIKQGIRECESEKAPTPATTTTTTQIRHTVGTCSLSMRVSSRRTLESTKRTRSRPSDVSHMSTVCVYVCSLLFATEHVQCCAFVCLF
jgi:hypothetical protein